MSKSARRSGIQKVNLVIMEKPVKPVMNGRSRCKFPSSKDCCVRLGIFDHANNEVRCKNTTQQSSVLTSKRNGTKFVLELTCVTRHAVNSSSIIDVPLHTVLLQRPLNCWKNNKHADGDAVGFWFRFFGKSCRFHVKISLRAIFQNKQQSRIIDTIELDIVNLECPADVKVKECSLSTYKRLQTTSLYGDKHYMNIMDKLQPLYEKCCWQECKVTCDHLMLKLESDHKVCILLLLSKVACQQGKPKDAKVLIKNALDMLPTNSNNKDLLMGRAYTCLSIAHQRDMALGSAEECLRIARTKLDNFVPCQDTGDFYAQQGKLLLGFIFQIPTLHKEIFNEAKTKFEKAIHHFQESCYRNKIVTQNKIHVSQLHIAIVLLLKDDNEDNAVIAEGIILKLTERSMGQLTYEIVCVLSFARAILANKLGDCDTAHVSGKAAYDLADKHGFLEKQWIEMYLGTFFTKS